MGASPAARLSVDEYLSLDRNAEIKSEFHDGELFPLVAVSLSHALISAHVTGVLERPLAKTDCRVAASPFRVRVSPTKFVIPDMLVFCGKAELTDAHADTITNPKVIIEILSPSTEDYDYGGKFALYRRLPSFEEYVLLSQDEVRVETFRKTHDNEWILRTHEGLDALVPVESLGISLSLREVYDGVALISTR
jgi:Uma2 family endonuclease